MNMDIIENSVALVTGANRGIGKAIVKALLERKASRVYAASRDVTKLEDLVSKYGESLIPIKMDVTKQEDIVNAMNVAHDINILVNNAGVFSEGNLLDVPIELIKRDMEVNYFGTLNVLRHFSSIMELNGGGSIINILSVSSLVSSPSIGSYSASKAAELSLTQTIRAQLSHKGINVHSVFPGPVDTDMTSQLNIQKADPFDVAKNILDEIEKGEEDIFPDNMSKQCESCWCNNPKLLERQLSTT
jgi:short-subunit dehydrogenase